MHPLTLQNDFAMLSPQRPSGRDRWYYGSYHPGFGKWLNEPQNTQTLRHGAGGDRTFFYGIGVLD
jgi:hypothetical protein